MSVTLQPHRLVLLLTLLVGGAIRFYGLGAKSLWFDEALSWRLVQFPVGEMVARTADTRALHPPLYFLTLRVWSGMWGDSEYALRSLAAVCGIATTLVRQANTVRSSEISRTTLFDIPQSIFTALRTTWAEPISVNPPAVWSFFCIVVLVFVFLAARGGWGGWFLLLAGLIPVILALVFSAFSGRGIVRARYLTIVQVAWLCSFAVVISRVPHRIERSILVCLSLALSFYSIANSWTIVGPSANPGIRQAVQHIRAQRGPDEPIMVRCPDVLFGASYYTRGVTRRLLCVSEPRPKFKHGTAHLREDDFISSDALSRRQVSGAWLLNTDSYEDSEQFLCPLPLTWELKDQAEFEQDYLWERPVIVEHYKISRPTGE